MKNITLITFGVFMTEAILHYNLGKEDVIEKKENQGWLPPSDSLIRLAILVSIFSFINTALIKKQL